jgi:hypothetical protein
MPFPVRSDHFNEVTPMTNDRPLESQHEETDDFLVKLRPVALGDPFRWLVQGTRDFMRAPAIGLFFGGCFVAMG